VTYFLLGRRGGKFFGRFGEVYFEGAYLRGELIFQVLWYVPWILGVSERKFAPITPSNPSNTRHDILGGPRRNQSSDKSVQSRRIVEAFSALFPFL